MIKGKIINFEWMCDHNHYTDEQFDPIKMKLIEKDLRSAANEGYNLIFGLYLMDGFLHCAKRVDNFISEMNIIKSLADSLSLKIILVSGQGEQFPGLPFDSLLFDYTLRMTYESYKQKENKIANLDTNKFLFLGGMSSRPNRIGLINRYYMSNMLESCEWSFFPPTIKDDDIWCRNYLSNYTSEEYENFIKYVDRSFDNKYQEVLNYFAWYETEGTDYIWYDVVKTEFIKNPTFIDPALFNKTSFSVISEGPNYWSEDNYFLTEKTWRTILNRHAFIFAGHPDQFRYLKKLGFKTFDEYMLIKDYALEPDEEKRLDAVRDNTHYFLDNLKKNKENVKSDIDYNYDLFFKLVENQNLFLKNLNESYNVSLDEISYFFNRIGYEQLIRKIPDGF